MPCKQFLGLLGIRGVKHPVPGVFENPARQQSDCLFVLDDQDGFRSYTRCVIR